MPNSRRILSGVVSLALALLVAASFATTELAAQASRRPPAVSGLVSITPAATASGSESKYLPWVSKANKGYADFRRGRLSGPEKVFRELNQSDRSNPIAKMVLSEILISRGKLAEARKILGSSSRRGKSAAKDPVPLTQWQILAPFPYGGGKNLRKELEPEKGEFDPKARYKGDGRICRWKKAKGPRVDFRRELDIEGSGLGYARCEFISKKSGWVRFGVASADGVKMWLNDAIVHENRARRRIQEDDDEVFAWLKRGKNTLVVKVDSRGDEFRFYIQIYEEVGRTSPEFLDAALAGFKSLSRKDWDGAREKLLAAESVRPSVPEIAIGLARVTLEQGNLIGARSWASLGLAKRPESEQGLTVYAETMLRLEQPLKAFDSFRAAYRASDYQDGKIHERWVESARGYKWDLQEGLALLDKVRGLRKTEKKSSPAVATVLAQAESKLSTTFVGLADLCLYHREIGDRKMAADLGVRALAKLTPQQIALHCSAEWLLDLVKDLRTTQPSNQEAREKILRLVEQVDPTRSDLIREILAVKPAKGRSAVSPKIEALLLKRPEKALYKEYVRRLFDAGDHAECVKISRRGLDAGIVSRTLRIKQAYSLLALKQYEDSEEMFRDLLEEKDYVDRANEGLKKVVAARSRDRG